MKSRFFISISITLGIVATIASCCKESSEPRIGHTTAVFNPNLTYDSITDIDGNVYKTITIGTQTWMAENLRVTHYRNGDPIPNVKDSKAWGKQTTGAYCYYKNEANPDSIATYGYLYNGYCMLDPRGLAPEGWHVPTDAEWYTLVKFVDGGDGVLNEYSSSVAGGRMKETGTLHWDYPNRFADNSSGFTAISGGWRQTYQGQFQFKGYGAQYWTTTKYHPVFFYGWGMGTDFASIGRNGFQVTDGISIRCVKD
jgi:uncharacterized protein (TIGR02145 family)